MNYQYDVSVIIPAKNVEKFLRETLNGLLDQTACENSKIEVRNAYGFVSSN